MVLINRDMLFILVILLHVHNQFHTVRFCVCAYKIMYENKEGCSLYTLPCSFKSYKACSFLSHTETDDPTEFHLLELLPD